MKIVMHVLLKPVPPFWGPANAERRAFGRHSRQVGVVGGRMPQRGAGVALTVVVATAVAASGNPHTVSAQSIPGESRVLDLGRLEENGASEQAAQFRTALEQRLTDLKAARHQVAKAKAKYEQDPCDETEAELLDATARAFVLEFRADERIVDVGKPLVGELEAAAAALVAAEAEIDGEIRAYEEAGEDHTVREHELDAEIQKIAVSVEHLLNTDEPLPSDVRAAVALTAAEAGRERRLAEANRTVADNTRLSQHEYKSYVVVLEAYSGQVGDAVNGARSRLVEIGEMGRLMQAECLRARRGRAAGRFVEKLGSLGELIAAISRAEAHWAIPRVTVDEPIDTGPADEHVKRTLREYLDKHRGTSAESGEIAASRE